MYEAGEWPRKVTMIGLKKKTKATKCSWLKEEDRSYKMH
jgi:hypothetical protein